MKYSLLALILSKAAIFSVAQNKTDNIPNKVHIDHADKLEFIKTTESIRKLLGQVRMHQDTTFIFCDSAYQYVDRNFVEAHSNIRILSGKVTITGDKLQYDANTKLADIFGNVVLYDGSTYLYTSHLQYDVNAHTGRYFEKGKIINANDSLTSKYAAYNTDTHWAEFREDVQLYAPDYKVSTQALDYNTDTQTAYFITHTRIFNDSSHIVCQKGMYHTSQRKGSLYGKVIMQDKDYILKGDSVYFSKLDNLGEAFKNVHLLNKDSTIHIFGQYAKVDDFHKYTYVTNKAYTFYKVEKDTVFITADTLLAKQDSTKKRYIYAYHRAKLYKKDFQAIADTLLYSRDDSVFYFIQSPVLWSENTQITGKSIVAYIKNKQLDSITVTQKGFMIQQEDSTKYNQLKGRLIQVKLKDNKIQRMLVSGNSESLYYVFKEDNTLSGMNYILCSEADFYFKDNRPSTIKFFNQPDGVFYPPREINQENAILKDFKWYAHLRPQKKDVVYP
ncbi:MAG: OstA-like protein [Bacteroidia bacterium]|nr:OstA-like protein [Bacteroidia bacterium]